MLNIPKLLSSVATTALLSVQLLAFPLMAQEPEVSEVVSAPEFSAASGLLEYLQLLDTNVGRSDLGSQVESLDSVKLRFGEIREEISYLIARSFRFQKEIASLQYPVRSESSDEEEVLIEATVAQLKAELLRSIDLHLLTLRTLESLEALSDRLLLLPVLDQASNLEVVFMKESDVISLLEQAAELVNSEIALSELYLDSALAEFWLSYSVTGKAVSDELLSVLSLDHAFLQARIDFERSLLDLIDLVYPDSSTPLDAEGLVLLERYFSESTDYYSELFALLSFQADSTVNFLSNYDLSEFDHVNASKLALLGELSDSVQEDVLASERLLADYSTLLENQNSGLLENSVLSDQFEVLGSFHSLLGLIDREAYQNDLMAFVETFGEVQLFERHLQEMITVTIIQDESAEGGLDNSSLDESETTDSSEIDLDLPEVPEGEVLEDSLESEVETFEEALAEEVEAETALADIEEVSLSESAPEEEMQSEDLLGVLQSELEEVELEAFVEDGLIADILSDEEIPVVEPIVEFVQDVIVEPIVELVAEEDVATEDPSLEESVEVEALPEAEELEVDLELDPSLVDDTDDLGELPIEPLELEEELLPVSVESDLVEVELPEIPEPVEELVLEEELLELPEVSPEDIAEEVVSEEVAVETVGLGESADLPIEDNPEAEGVIEPVETVETANVESEETIESEDESQPNSEDSAEDGPVEEETLPEEEAGFLERAIDVIEEELLIHQLIVEDVRIQSLDRMLLEVEARLFLAQEVQGLLDELAPNTSLEDFELILANHNYTDNDLDELLSFLNQFAVQFGYLEGAEQFQGTVGVLRYEPTDCLLDSDYDFVGFCLAESSDISIKNVAGYPSFEVQQEESHVLSENGLTADWKLDAAAQLSLSSPLDSEFLMTLSFADVAASSLSVLDDPEMLFSPSSDSLSQMKTVAFGTEDQRVTLINTFLKDEALVEPKHFDFYHLFHFGEGSEQLTLRFDDVVLREGDLGAIEGYFFVASEEVDSAEGSSEELDLEALEETPSADELARLELHENGRPQPDFILNAPILLDSSNQLLSDLSYIIGGDHFNELLLDFAVEAEAYPVVVRSQLQLLSSSQVEYDARLNLPSFSAFTDLVSGDFNGDGLRDLAMASPEDSSGSGAVHIHYLDGSGVFAPNKDPDLTLEGELFSRFGSSLSVFDVNEDSISDLLVGSPGFDSDRGQVQVFLGSNEGLSLAHTIQGQGREDEFGSSVLVADLDASEKADLLVSAPGDLEQAGTVYLFVDSILEADVSEANYRFSGELNKAGRFGSTFAYGDFDADGLEDFLVSAPLQNRVYLFLQNETPWTKEDDACQNNCSAQLADVVFEGEHFGDQFGAQILASDLDLDGHLDVLVSSPQFDFSSLSQEGRAYVFYQEFCSEDPCLASEADLILTGNSGDSLGTSLELAYWTQDDELDLILSAPTCDSGQGCVYVFENLFEEEVSAPLASSDASKLWKGAANSAFGFALLVADYTSDSLSDLFVATRSSLYLFEGRGSADLFLKPVATTDEEEEVRSRIPELPVVAEESLLDESLEDETIDESSSNFDVLLDEIETAVEFVVSEEAEDEIFALDVTTPEAPLIECEGFEEGVFSDLTLAGCQWSDTAGPSLGTYYYCIDEDNACVPDLENPDRSLELELASQSTYLRVRTVDLGGEGEIASFHLTTNQSPEIVLGPSDGGSSDLNPTPDANLVNFSATAADPDNNPYRLLICRTNADPVYTAQGPDCGGVLDNRYCRSDLTASGTPARCSFDNLNETFRRSIWYAFVCDAEPGIHGCSPASQGEGQNGSPFYTDHPAGFGGVTVTDQNDGVVEPGDSLRFRLASSEFTDVPRGQFATMTICSSDTTSYNYQAGECLGGQLICRSEPTDVLSSDVRCDELVGSSMIPIPTPSQSKEFSVFVELANGRLVDGVHVQSFEVVNSPPALINYINEGEILILGGGKTQVSFSVILEDLNGSQDITSVEGAFFDADTVEADCSASRNHCYIDEVCSLTILDDLQLRADCSVEVYYNASASQNWEVQARPSDLSGLVDSLEVSNSNREVPPLSAINQEELAIPYGPTSPGQFSDEVTTMLTNLGNQPVDVLVSGTDLQGDQYSIDRIHQKWSLEPNFDYETEGFSLVELADPSGGPLEGCLNVTLPVHLDPLQEEVEQSLYWKLFVPSYQKADRYSGSVSFSHALDRCSSDY